MKSRSLLRIVINVENVHCCRLTSSLERKLSQAKSDLETLDTVATEINSLRSTLQSVESEVRTVFVFGEDQNTTDQVLQVGRPDNAAVK